MANTLTKLCIISTILGIALLVIISDKLSLPTSTIASITKEQINKPVVVKGTIKDILVNKESLSLLEVQDKSSSIKVALFKPDKITLQEGSFIEVYGRVSLYNEEVEIIAETIKILN